MSFRGTLFLAVFFAVANGQGCSVCGDGKSVTAPDAIFEFPTFDPVACGELQTAGRNGEIPLDGCAALPPFIDVCACAPDSGPSPTGAPMGTAKPTTLKPTTPGQGCSICGDGKSVTAPDAIFAFPYYDPIACGELQTAGLNGELPLENCLIYPDIIGVCACAPDSGTSPNGAPMGTASPTRKPTRRPTQKPTSRGPTRKPTRRPTQKPTSRGPTRNPTRRPTQKPTSRVPTRKPTRRPTQKPTARGPTRKPTRRPTLKPTL
ncbi:hypothetical protein MHU86_2456 [Fragilaria crotonensis]|nr:hypothetical protein MHU86_2456 [Fragilaria crotonensis]